MDNLPPNILKLHLRMKIEVLDEEQAFKEINEKIHQMKEMQEQFQYEIDEIKTENNKLANELKKTLKDKGLLAVERENLLVIKRELSDNNNRLNNEISLLNDQISRLMHEKSILAQEYTTLVTSKIWKSTKPVRLILDSVKNLNKKFVNLIRECFKLILKTKQNLKTIGLTNTIKKIYNKGPESLANVKESGKLAEIVQEHDIWREITQWIENTPHSFVDIFHVPMG